MAAPTATTIQDDIAKLKEKYAELSEDELKKAFKAALKPKLQTRKEEKEAIALKMREVVATFDRVALNFLKRELVNAWKEKHPNGNEKQTRQPTEWHKFIRDNREKVLADHPNSSQHERIRIMGVLYKNHKAAAPAAPAEPVVPTPAPTKNGKKKN